jgi:predicted enzyme related to lactoylglutathione lyase
MPRVNHFAIPADAPERAIHFYQQVFDWKFEVGWEYDTPQGREKYWHILTGDGDGINGGLTRREYPGQPISVAIDVSSVEHYIQAVQNAGGKIIVNKVALPGVAWFAVCQDSEGNTFAMVEVDANAGR